MNVYESLLLRLFFSHIKDYENLIMTRALTRIYFSAPKIVPIIYIYIYIYAVQQDTQCGLNE